jgi:nucleotide-binding universal stress UspA family protein
MRPAVSPHSSVVRAHRHPISCVVVAVDPSTPSERAVQLALSVEREDARTEFVFCHVIDIPRMLARAERVAEDYEVALSVAREQAQTLLDLCLAFAENAGVFGRSCIRYGKPAAEIVSVAELFSADLIVVGNRRRPWVRRVLRGSVPDEIVRMSDVPVLIVQSEPAP